MLNLPGLNMPLNAVVVDSRPSEDDSAWVGPKHTVQLMEPLQALRLSFSGSGGGASADERNSARSPRWFAVGDVVLSRSDYANQYALRQVAYKRQDDYTLPVGAVINIGVAAAKWGYDGGGVQAELLGGTSTSKNISGFWSDRHGRA